MAKKSDISVSKVTGVAVGTAAAAVAAAGAYWFYGSKDAARHRKSARSWMLKARAEAMEAVEMAIEQAGDIDKEKYLEIVKNTVKRYSGVAGITTAELAQVTKDLTGAWLDMQKARKVAAQKATKSIKKSVKKAVKKSKKVLKK